jgi:hypothetical protein
MTPSAFTECILGLERQATMQWHAVWVWVWVKEYDLAGEALPGGDVRERRCCSREFRGHSNELETFARSS